MWMMGYSDGGGGGGGGEINTLQDPFTGRKLRPLMPRPAPVAPPCLARIHGADLFALNHHLAMAEQNKRDLNTQQVVVSSRWNPTPEQLQTLEEMYRRGTRTPSAEQIQHITAQLRRYGKIEGKNVFYWFQNHKARERQKRRRQLESFPDEQLQLQPHSTNHDKRDPASGANRTLFEVEQTKNWSSPTNSSTAAEKSGQTDAECKADDGWVQFDDDAELQRRRNATWQMMNLSCSSSSSPTNLFNSSPSSSSPVTLPAIPSTLATMQFNPQHFLNILFEPYSSLNPYRSGSDSSAADAQTLELFPLQGGGDRPGNDECSDDNEEEDSRASVSSNINASHVKFFEFLPLKN